MKNRSSGKVPKYLKYPAIVLLIAGIMLPYKAEAKVIAYVTQGADNELYEYDYDDLVRSFVFDSAMYREFSKGEIKYLLDDVNGYVDYYETVRAFVFSSGTFDLNTYTSGPNAKVVGVSKVQVVTVEDGVVKHTEKILGDPVIAALNDLNSAPDPQALREVLESRANVLGLDLSLYDLLFDYGKNLVVSGVFNYRGGGYTDVGYLKAVFVQEVQRVRLEVDQALDLVNSAWNQEELSQILLANGTALGLELHSYSMIISTRKDSVISRTYASAPYNSVAQLRETFNNAVADVLGSYVVVGFTDYSYTLSSMVDIQMTRRPQWWVTGAGWRNAPRSEVEYYVNPFNFVMADLAGHVTEAIISTDVLLVRESPTTNSNQIATTYRNEIYRVEEVIEVIEGTSASSLGYWFRITVGGNTGWISGNFTDWVAEDYSSPMFQFLVLSGSSGVTVSGLGTILNGKGILSGMEEVFYQASRENGINEVFLTALALHESGNGTSQLANGILFTPEDPNLEPRVVYNMYGIGAVDSSPNYKGAEYAYSQGWFTPEAAIIGGAYFASNNYVNNTAYRQDTLYKMRWNPGNPGTHQYATDIAWASKQTSFIRQLYQQVNIFHLRFDIPRYLR